MRGAVLHPGLPLIKLEAAQLDGGGPASCPVFCFMHPVEGRSKVALRGD